MTAKKRNTQSVTMAVERTLLARARAADINLSATLTAALDTELRRHEAKKWQEENTKALEALNRFHEQQGGAVMNTGRFSLVIRCIKYYRKSTVYP